MMGKKEFVLLFQNFSNILIDKNTLFFKISFLNDHTASFLGGYHRNTSVYVGFTNMLVGTLFKFMLFTFLAAYTVDKTSQ